MLDQNTDRMWYVIGAVLVGAAIILIANSTIPEIFANVGGTFSETTDETIYFINSNYGRITNLFHSNYELRETLQGNDFITYSHNDKGGITLTNTSGTRSRAKVRLEGIIPYGSLYAVSFDMVTDSPNGAAIQVDISDINEYPGTAASIPDNVTTEKQSYLVTVRHDGEFDHTDTTVNTKMNFVDFNVILNPHSSVVLEDIVVSRVIE